MRQVSACDFCGAEGAGTFEVLPPEVDGGRRMVLCPDCRDTLGTVVDPLLDHLRGGSDIEPAASDPPTDVEPDAERGDAASGASPDAATQGAGRTRMAATGAGTSSSVPRGYRKVLRFLENREFPIDRSEAVTMAAEAYGLEEEAVEAAIDHAVKHDRLKSFDGELQKV